MRLIDATPLVREILDVRDKIPRTVPPRPYEFGEQINEAGNMVRGGIRKALHCIETAPTIDAVPVVRCRECKHWGDHDVEVPGETDKIKACGWAIWMVGENGFCVFGERRDEA